MKRFLPSVLLLACVPILSFLFATRLLPPVDAYRSPLKDLAPAPGEALGEPLTRRVVFVLIDGLRLDVSQDRRSMPYLNELRSQGAAATMRSRAPSYSTPSYGVLLTGAWPDLSDAPTNNLEVDRLWPFTQDNLFLAARRSGAKTAVAGYYWFEKLIPPPALDAGFYVPGEDAVADQAVMDAARPWLNDPSYGFVLVHLDQVDYAGHHEGGGAGKGYASAAHRVDELLREIVAPLDLAQDTLVIASDHGHLDRGGHGGPDPVVTTEPFIMLGAGVRPGQYPEIQMVDLAPTLAVLLGANLPASTQGQAQVKMLQLAPQQLSRLRSLESQQQAQLLLALRLATGLQIEPEAEAVHPAQALQDALVDALDPGFTGRLVVGLGVVVLLLVIWLRRHSRLALWAFTGAAGYALLFHETYVVLLERTYSLSSVESAGDLVAATMSAAGLVFLFVWFVIWLGMRWFEDPPANAARVAFELVLAVLTLLLLPVLLHLAWNGPWPRYFLPDYWLLFLALSALIQMTIVVLVGLLLAGLSLFVSAHYRKNPVMPASQ